MFNFKTKTFYLIIFIKYKTKFFKYNFTIYYLNIKSFL